MPNASSLIPEICNRRYKRMQANHAGIIVYDKYVRCLRAKINTVRLRLKTHPGVSWGASAVDGFPDIQHSTWHLRNEI
ncbi:MAG: hypothetical protein NHB32_01900 [Fischerella sp. CENA71]|nr:hypothetical protein [Fischerella sp. CENA71]